MSFQKDFEEMGLRDQLEVLLKANFEIFIWDILFKNVIGTST